MMAAIEMSPGRLTFLLPVLLWVFWQSPVCARAGYPEFSWDRVPLYAHVGLGTGLKPEEYRFLADHYGFIAFTGGRIDREYRDNNNVTFERIVTEAARAVKQRNPKAKVLFYWAGDLAKPHNRISNAMIPEDGRIRYLIRGNVYSSVFDTTNEATRAWWTDVAARAVHEYSCDGIFVDGATAFRPDGAAAGKLGQEKAAALDRGMLAMLQEARRKMGGESIILFNPLHAPKENQKEEEALGWRYLPVTDGAMVDDFDRAANIMERRQGKEYIANTIKTMAKAARQGKIVVFKAWPGFTWWSDKELMKKPHAAQYAVAVENIEFPLACFLVGAERYCYFCYTWGWLPDQGPLDWYPEFDKPLGAPKGDAIEQGWTFRREFEHASVLVDVENRTGRIDWKSTE